MKHPGERSGLTLLGVDGHGPRRDERAFEHPFPEILRAFILSATYDEVYVPDQSNPQGHPAVCLLTMCEAFAVDVAALRKAAEWDTLSKGQKAEREKASADVCTPPTAPAKAKVAKKSDAEILLGQAKEDAPDGA